MALRIASLAAVAVAVSATVACSSSDPGGTNNDDAGNSSSSSSGGSSSSSSSGGTGDAGAPATWTMVYSNILSANGTCTGCHANPASPVFGNLDMSTKAIAYAALVGVKASGGACASANVTRVLAGQSAQSLLYSKVAATTPICGVRMPQGGPYLSAAQIAMVASWIDAGALNN